MFFRVVILFVVLLDVLVCRSLGAKHHRQRHQLAREVDYRYESVSDFSRSSSWIKQMHDTDQKSEKGQRQRHNKHGN